MHKGVIRGSVLTAALVFSACSQDVTAPTGVAGSAGSGNHTDECRNTFVTGNRHNILVPEGAFCSIFEARILGNVTALEGSRLTMQNVTISGDIEANRARAVDMFSFPNSRRNVVEGNIHIKQGGGTGSTSWVIVCGTDLPNGNIHIDKTQSDVLVGGTICNGFGGGNILTQGNVQIKQNVIDVRMEVSGNTVGGNMQVFKNTGTGAKSVQNNTVAGNLRCFDNTPPFVGGPNTAGKAEGQCF